MTDAALTANSPVRQAWRRFWSDWPARIGVGGILLLLLPALAGEAIVLLALAALFPLVGFGSMAEGAAVYLLGALSGALAGVYMVTRKRPLELLQVKE